MLKRIIILFAWGFALFFLYKTVVYHAAIISLNSPQEYREDASIILTCRLLDGKSIFTAADMPMYFNNYGFLYSFVAAPGAKIFGCDYTVHRAVTAVFALASLLVLYLMAMKLSKNHLTAFLAIVILYHNIVQNPYEIGPKPDTLGTFIFLLAVLLPWLQKFSTASLLGSAMLAVLGFYTKPYFVAAVLYVGGYLLFTRQWKKAVSFGGFFLVFFLAWAALVNRTYDFYFFNTVISTGKLTEYKWWYQAQLTSLYAKQTFGLILPVAILGFAKAASRRTRYIVFCLACSLILVIGKLGGNPGGYLQYYDALIGPFLYLTLMMWQTRRTAMYTCMLLFANIIFLYTTTAYTVDSQKITENWTQWKQYLNGYHTMFGSPPFALYNYRRDMPVYDAGHAEYFRMGTPGTHPEIKLFRTAIARYDAEFRDVENKIFNNEFDLLIYWMPYTQIVEDLLYKGYLREYVQTHYRYDGCRPWITAYGTSCFDVWVRPTTVI